VEGRPVAIAEALTLPNQPGVGEVTYITLGGDGYVAPFAAYAIDNWTVTADASGGLAVYTMTMDRRFVALISYICFQGLQGVVADVGLRYIIRGNPGAPTIARALLLDSLPATAVVVSLNDVYVPPPVLLPGGQTATIVAQTDNVDGDTYFLSALVYLFNIDVRQKASTGPLLWSRGVT